MFFEEKSVKADRDADIARNHACCLSSCLVSFCINRGMVGRGLAARCGRQGLGIQGPCDRTRNGLPLPHLPVLAGGGGAASRTRITRCPAGE